ncbi:MAG: hypothetical protein ACX93N_02765 [Pseudohaliea sp.]
MTLAPALHSLPPLLLATGPLLALLAMARAGAPRFAGPLRPAVVAHAGMAATALALGLPALAGLQVIAAIACAASRSETGQALLARAGREPIVPSPRQHAWASAVALALPLALVITFAAGPGGLAGPWQWIAAFLLVALTERSVAPPRAPLAAAGAFAILLLAGLAP